jgi:hypothetical protein
MQQQLEMMNMRFGEVFDRIKRQVVMIASLREGRSEMILWSEGHKNILPHLKMNLLMRTKMKKLKILTIHQSTKVIDLNSLETKEMRDFNNIRISIIEV